MCVSIFVKKESLVTQNVKNSAVNDLYRLKENKVGDHRRNAKRILFRLMAEKS